MTNDSIQMKTLNAESPMKEILYCLLHGHDEGTKTVDAMAYDGGNSQIDHSEVEKLMDKLNPPAKPEPEATTTTKFTLSYDTYRFHSVEIEAETLEEAIAIGKSMNDERVIESFHELIKASVIPEDDYYLVEITWTDENDKMCDMQFGA